MIPFAAAVVLAASAAPAPPPAPEWKVTGAALFKNGYAVVFREALVGGKQAIDLPVLPSATLGTQWFTTEGAKITSLLHTTTPQSIKATASSLAEVLRLNKGKTLTLEVLKPGAASETITGVLVEVIPGHVVVKAGGREQLIPIDAIRRVSSAPGVALSYQSDVQAEVRSFRFTFDRAHSGKVYSMSLEPGLSWMPSYAAAITGEGKGKVTLTSKATVINDLDKLTGASLMLVTGFPHIPYLGMPDPFGAAGRALAASMGGMPGGSGARFANQAVAAPSPMADAAGGFEIPAGEGNQAEDLFFYRTPAITMKKGDRAYQVLFQKEADYKSVYRADLMNPLAGGSPLQRAEVWHTLEFLNPADQPLTTGPAITMRDGQIVGQDEISYTPRGGEVRLRVNKALDVVVTQTGEETAREREALKDRNGSPTHDLVTLEGKVTARNMKSREVEVVLEMVVEGEAKASRATVKKLSTGLQQINPKSSLTWRITLKPGESVDLDYSVKVYIGR